MKTTVVVHHIRHTRPAWYHQYHRWKYSGVLHLLLLGLSTVLLLLGAVNLVYHPQAAALSTTVTEELLPGDLGVSLPAFLSFSQIVSNTRYEQRSTAVLQNIGMSDSRGSGVVGWSVTASATDFVSVNQPILQHGIHNTVSVSGNYDGSDSGAYVVTIVSGGNRGEATFSVDGLETQSETKTEKSIPLGTRGLTVSFAPANYVPGDSWIIRVDTIPINNLTMTPYALSAVSGTVSGVSIGEKHTFTGRNDQASIMIASNDHQSGSFLTNILFSLRIPSQTYAGRYVATFTVTTD